MTVGGLMKRIEVGESFDVVVMTPETVDQLIGKGKVISGSRTDLGARGRRRDGEDRREPA